MKECLKEAKSGIVYRKIGEGPHKLLLIHGFCEDGSCWDDIADQLAEEVTVIVPDLPGWGRSSHLPFDNITMQSSAKMLMELLQEEEIFEAIVIGHSMGGYISLEFAAHFPEMVMAIGLVNSHVFGDDEKKRELREKSIRVIEKGGKERFIKELYGNLFDKNFIYYNEERFSALVKYAQQHAADALVRYYRAMMLRSNRSQLLQYLGKPVLIVAGENDATVPKEVSLKQMCLADVTMAQFFAECGHMSMLEESKKTVDSITQFISLNDILIKGE